MLGDHGAAVTNIDAVPLVGVRRTHLSKFLAIYTIHQ